MIAAVVATLFIPFLLVYCYRNAYKRPPNFPPGPPSLPVYGGFWIVLSYEFSNLALAFQKIGEKYRSKVIGVFLGPVPAVILNDPTDIKEMLYREEFDGRMDIILFRLRSYWKKLGIFFTDGYFWHVQRRFSLRYLRDFGFGRRSESLEAVIADEIKEMIDMRINGPKYPAEKELVNGDLVYLPHYFAAPFINGIVHVLSRMTVPRKDYQVLWELARGTLLFQRSSNDLGGALSLTPWLKDVLPNYSGYNSLVKGNQYLLNFFTKLVNEVMETHDETHDQHFLDMYITKMKEEQKTKLKTTYSIDQLVLTCTDYMFPSASAVQATLTILVERMLLQPEIQDKVHEEIDRVVGRDRLPNLDDRKDMPYTEACLREVMRHETLVPLGVPHRAMVDTKIGGYDIMEGTMVSPNLVMLHMDKKIWGDPENFRPERFLENGQLCLSKDKSLPFGAVGKEISQGMPYTEACLREVMRHETLVPLGVPHRAMVDTKIGGYDIMEGTMVSPNLVMLHMDKKIWGDPENFRPERFLENGQLCLSKDKSLPFGAGRRLCAGETYARQSMFQVFTAFMQAFHVSTADGRPLQKPAPRIQGIITTIPNFWIRATPRSLA